MKKIFKSILAFFISFAFAGTPLQIYADADYDDTAIIENTAIIEQGIVTIYIDPIIHQQIIDSNSISTLSSDLFEIDCKYTIYQLHGGKVDLGLSCIAKNHRAQISYISGMYTTQDTSNYASESQKIYSKNNPSTYIINSYNSGKKSYTKNHEIKVSWNIYITLTYGYVLNGGKVSGESDVTIVR